MKGSESDLLAEVEVVSQWAGPKDTGMLYVHAVKMH